MQPPEQGSVCANSIHGWRLFIGGVCMGIADLIPGISGGTMAFILGFYQPLLESLKSLNLHALARLLKGNGRAFLQEVQWKFLLTLVSGICFSIVCFSNLIHAILSNENYRVYLYAIFSGLILASFVFCLKQVRMWNSRTIAALCVGAIVAFLLTESTLSSSKVGEYAVPIASQIQGHQASNFDNETGMLYGLSQQDLGILLAQGWIDKMTPVHHSQQGIIGTAGDLSIPYQVSFMNGWLVVCGSLAICALLLPGISGSYVLALLGVYPLIIESLVDFIHGFKTLSFHVEAFSILSSVGIGIFFGAILFARCISWLLRQYPHITLALLSGFMIGAIRSVWPFWTYGHILMPLKIERGPQLVAQQPFIPQMDSPVVWLALICALAAFALVYYLERKVLLKESCT